jgi:hypothetical protein
MKNISALTLLFLFCCNHEISSQTQYLPEYQKYQRPVAFKMGVLNKTIADSARVILDEYLHDIAIYSCTWCVAEGKVFEPVAGFTKRHPESLILVLDRSLQGTGLTWGFRVLFRELYPVQYQALLKKANIELLPESEIKNEEQRWQNQSKEYSLAFNLLADEYLAIIK